MSVDIRVHVVGEEAIFPTLIQSDDADYRYDQGAKLSAHRLPAEIEELCFDVAHALHLPLAGIDLRETPEGEFYCFEVNPSPAYDYYESHTGQPITKALCDLLQRG